MFQHLKTNEVALLLHGLRACWVIDEAKTHKKLTRMLETELASRGFRLCDPHTEIISKTDMVPLVQS